MTSHNSRRRNRETSEGHRALRGRIPGIAARAVRLGAVAAFVVACGAGGIAECEPILDEFLPLAQSAIDAIDSEDGDAFAIAASELEQLREEAIDARCPAETLASMVAERSEDLASDSEQGQAAIDDLVLSGPFQYVLGNPAEEADGSSSPKTTTSDATTDTTESRTLCDADVVELVSEIIGEVGEGVPGTSSLGFDYCVWEAPNGELGLAILPQEVSLPEDKELVFPEFGIVLAPYARSATSVMNPVNGPSHVVVYATNDVEEREVDSLVTQLHLIIDSFTRSSDDG